MSNSPPNAIHGNLYHAKILAHFLIRGITCDYSFQLGREEVGVGKFDDVVFSYKEKNERNSDHWCYRYFQVKHKFNKELEKIKASQLLDENDKRFGLCDYLSSYDRIRKTGVDVQDCIICTNMRFDMASFKKEGIKLVVQNNSDEILAFPNLPRNKLPKRYKLTGSRNLYALLKSQAYYKYNWKVWDELLDSFFQKLVFLVDTPGESELDHIRTEEIKYYFKLPNDADFLAAYLLKEILDWFTNPESRRITSDDAKYLLEKMRTKMESLRITNISRDNQHKLSNILEFNDIAIFEMRDKIEQLLLSSVKVKIIISPFPTWTAAKVMAALNKTRNYHTDDSYLVMPSHYLKDKDERQLWVKTFQLVDSHRLLVIVSEDDPIRDEELSYLTLIPSDKEEKSVIVIEKKDASNKDLASILEDALLYEHLSETSKMTLLSKKVSFQECQVTVKHLFSCEKSCDVIDLPSMEELMLLDKKVTIPSFNTHLFEKSSYIKRRITFPFPVDCLFWDEQLKLLKNRVGNSVGWLGESKCIRVNSKGGVEWVGDWDERGKTQIWDELKCILDDKTNSFGFLPFPIIESEEEFIKEDPKRERRIVILSGMAGTGKSTILSQYYNEIRNANPNTWVIRIKLAEHSDTFLKFNSESISEPNVTEFFITHFSAVFNNSPFARSLLRHRLDTAGQIVVMLDGFDEIDTRAQEKTIQFMKALNLTKLDRLYVTTRPHMTDTLEDKLFQFSYTLENFSEDDQIHYLCNYWTKNFTVTDYHQQLAKKIVNALSKNLTFVGIPLQCQILAECLQSDGQTKVRDSGDDEIEHAPHSVGKSFTLEHFNLAYLYKMFIFTKRQVFLQEKANASTCNPIISTAINFLLQKIESHLTKVAVQTLVLDQKDADVLWPASPHQSRADQVAEENMISECSLKFGLTYKNGKNGKVQFLHRTFSEYLVAKYLYEGFALGAEKHNELLDKTATRHLILSKILADYEYRGVRMFLDDMLGNIVESVEWEFLMYYLVDPIPLRLKQLYTEDIPENDTNSNNCARKINYRTIRAAILEKRENMFTFLFDGLDAVMNKNEIRQLLNYTLNDYLDYYDQSSRILKRCLDYYDNAQANEVEGILDKLMYNGSRGRIKMLKYTHPDQEKRAENIKLVLDCLAKHKEILKQLQKKKNVVFGNYKYLMLEVLFSNGHFSGLLKQYLELLSWLYTGKDDSFIQLLNFVIDKCDKSADRVDQIKLLITVLKDIGRTNIVDGISYLILKWYPDAYEYFYLSRPEEGEEKEPSEMLNRLHRFAFHGDLENSKRLFKKLLRTATKKNKKLVNKIVACYTARVGDSLTPLHIAATRGHKEIIHATLFFLKKVLPDSKLQTDLTKKNGFLHNIVVDSIIYGNVEMFELILKSVHQIVGTNSLTNLLRVHNNIMVHACRDSSLLEVIANILHNVKAHKELNDLIFQTGRDIENLRHVDFETVQKMLTVNGCTDWLKQLLDNDIIEGFCIVSHYFDNFDTSQRSKIIEAITRPKASKGQKSYWVEWLYREFDGQLRTDSRECYMKLLKWILENLGEQALIDLLMQDSCKPITRVLLLCREDNPIEAALKMYLSTENRKVVGTRIVKKLPSIMRNFFLEEKAKHFICWMNILKLVTDFAGNRQLLKIVHTILYEHDFNGKKFNIWNMFFYHASEDMDDKIDRFFKCVADKLGQSILKDLILHNNGRVITRALLLSQNGNLVKVVLAHFSKEIQDEVGHCVVDTAPEIMENIFLNPRLLSELRWMNISQLVVDYANSHQLARFVQVISTVHKIGREQQPLSMWADCFGKNLNTYYPHYNLEQKVDEFLKCISQKLGASFAKDLVLHNAGNGIVLLQIPLLENEKLIKAMLAYDDEV